MESWKTQNILAELKEAGKTADNELTEYIFYKLASILKERGKKIKYGKPEWDDPEKGFSIAMFCVGSEAYAFAEQCCIALGKEPLLECGTTMSVNFDSASDKDAFFDRFLRMMEKAEGKVDRERFLNP